LTKFLIYATIYSVESQTRLRRWCSLKKDGCLRPAGADRRRMYSPRGKFFRREAIHITAFSVVVGVFTILGAIAAIAALIYEIVRNRKKK